jgi:antitoxin component of RelBE/YafQ-DinJ toxin-antitoxin module
MTPEQALQVLAQVVAQTRALPQEVDAMRQALQTLAEAIAEPEGGDE